MLTRLTHWLDLVLQVATIAMIVILSVVVLMGVGFRYSGNSLIWYDEVAAVLLAWITFTGAALAVLRNAHLGFNGLLFGLPLQGRLTLFWGVEAIFVVVCGITAWAGWAILEIFGNENHDDPALCTAQRRAGHPAGQRRANAARPTSDTCAAACRGPRRHRPRSARNPT